MNLEEFLIKMENIKNLGFVRTHRAGTTGIGKTLEDLLDIEENNISGPDFDVYELKSMRKNANSMLTLITKSPDSPQYANTFLRINYGYPSGNYDNDERVLHSTLDNIDFTRISNTGHCLKVAVDDYAVHIINESYDIVASWGIDTLINAVNKKISSKQIVFVRAESRGQGELEEFHYNEVYLLDGFSPESFIKLICDGRIKVDLRIGQYHDGPNKGKTHDHGTGFRIFEKDHYLLFNVSRLL